MRKFTDEETPPTRMLATRASGRKETKRMSGAILRSLSASTIERNATRKELAKLQVSGRSTREREEGEMEVFRCSLSSGWKILVHIDRGGSAEMLFHSLGLLNRHLILINSPCGASPSTENIKNMNHELVKFFALFTLRKLREKSPRRVGGVGMIDESSPCWRSSNKKLSRDADKRVK